MSKTIYYPSEVETMIDIATAQLVREETARSSTFSENDCPLRNRLAGIFGLGDKIKAMMKEGEE